MKEAELSSLHERFAAMEGRLEQAVRREAEIQECVASVQEFELRPEQLQVSGNTSEGSGSFRYFPYKS